MASPNCLWRRLWRSRLPGAFLHQRYRCGRWSLRGLRGVLQRWDARFANSSCGGEDDVPLMLSWDFLMWRNGLVVKLAASTVAPSELSCKFQQTTCRSAPRPDRSVLYDRPYLCVSRFMHEALTSRTHWTTHIFQLQVECIVHVFFIQYDNIT